MVLNQDPWSLLELPENLVVFRLDPFSGLAKLYPLEKTLCFRKCSKKECEVCENVQNPDAFRNSVTSETFKINH